MSRRKIETSVPREVADEAARFVDALLADYPERCPVCGFRWPVPGKHQCAQ